MFKDKNPEIKIDNLIKNPITLPESKEEIIDNYSDMIPDLRDYIEFKQKGLVNFNFINKEIREELISNRVKNLYFSIIDIRNNNSPTSIESNTIIKTDNKFSNETKRLVKTLVSKGISTNEIGYEMNYLYGNSTICSKKYQENIPTKDVFKYGFTMFSEASIIFFSLKFLVKSTFYLLRLRK